MNRLHDIKSYGRSSRLPTLWQIPHVGRSFFFGSGQCADLCIKMDIEALLQFIYSQYKYRNYVKMYTKL